MRALAVLSMHTSPLAQPGTGDGGGMNVYVRELCSALARSGTQCDVFTRAWSDRLEAVVPVEPGLRVHHIAAGPLAPLPKEELPAHVDEFTDGVRARLADGPWGPGEAEVEAIHANYWLSGVSGHRLKHELDLPLLCTFHTLARVKAGAGGAEVDGRVTAEASVIGCADAVLSSNDLESDQIVGLYGAAPDRVRVVHPGVDHAFFSPGNRRQARRALGLPEEGRMLLFLGRIQPLKGADIAVGALGELADAAPDAFLVVVGGPSGRDGTAELERLRDMVAARGLGRRVRFFPPQPHELVSTFCRAADLCLVPSKSESFGLVALEAAACGTPTVATAVGGLRTVVVDGRTGVLVDERTPSAFAAAALSVLEDPEGATAMGRAAALWSRRFRWSAAADAVRGVYRDIAAGELVECS